MRARNLKPGICTNEVLGKADPFCTLLFERLWLIADRLGRLEDRPERIQVEAFPYRPTLDVESLLVWLESNRFIHRYEVQGKRYIEIIEFGKHQKPHTREVDSVIPPRPTNAQPKHNPVTAHASPDHSPGSNGYQPRLTSSSGHVALIPDSGSSDSLIADSPVHSVCDLGGDDEKGIWEWIQRIKAAYPAGAIRVDWIGAERIARQIVSNGEATWEEMLAGVERYAKLCAAVPDRAVMNPKNFFGEEDRPWSQPWAIPRGKSNGLSVVKTKADYAAEVADEDAKRRMKALAADSVDGLLNVFLDHLKFKDHPDYDNARLGTARNTLLNKYTLEQARTILLYTLDHNLDHLSATKTFPPPTAEGNSDAQRTGS